MKSLLTCLVLGLLSVAGVYALGFAPASDDLAALQEGLLAPGAAFAALPWPDGMHSNAPGAFLAMCMFVNLVFYSLLWLVVFAAVVEVRTLLGHRR